MQGITGELVSGAEDAIIRRGGGSDILVNAIWGCYCEEITACDGIANNDIDDSFAAGVHSVFMVGKDFDRAGPKQNTVDGRVGGVVIHGERIFSYKFRSSVSVDAGILYSGFVDVSCAEPGIAELHSGSEDRGIIRIVSGVENGDCGGFFGFCGMVAGYSQSGMADFVRDGGVVGDNTFSGDSFY